MRLRNPTLTIALLLGVFVVGFYSIARGDEGDAAAVKAQVEALEAKTAVLEKQVEYLLLREADLTTYAVKGAERGAALVAMVGRMRTQGFENKAIPAPSRTTLMAGLAALGKDLSKGVPKLTRAQTSLLRAAKRSR